MDANSHLIVKTLGFMWLLPATILCWLFYILPLLIFKEIKYVGKHNTFIWEFSNPIDPSSWYDNLWHMWGGWSGPCVMIIHEDYYELSTYYKTIKTHEGDGHCNDQFKWGIFFYPAYIIHCIWTYLTNFLKAKEDRRHIYLDNYFERRARKIAGQRVEIPQQFWPHGPDDYCPWF